MFGYFRFLNQYSDYTAQAVYKNYYCGLCFALDMHYGPLSRMLLSYDVTVLALVLHAHPAPKCDRLKCMGCKDCKKDYFSGETWKKIAAVNILLAAEKMSDDIADEASLKAKAGAFFFKKVIRKAKSDYPQLQQVIRSGYGKIVAAEKENRSVLQIGDLFADMMAGILKEGFQAPAVAEDYIRQISRWLYFIDALDDYDADLKKHRFNPIAIEGVPYGTYLNLHYPEIAGYLDSLYSRYDGLCRELADGSYENEILISILKNSIPAVTALVMHQRSLPELLHCRSGSQWRAKT